MTRRHEERYARAMARITPQREDATRAKVIKAVQDSKKKNIRVDAIDLLTNHKLGIRRVKP